MTASAVQPSLSSNAILDEIDSYLRSEIKPKANLLDHDSVALFEAFKALGLSGWLTPKISEALGGLGFSTGEYQQFQGTMARYSGALAFLQTQHQSAASLLASSDNEALKQTYIADMAKGVKQVGVGFSHLRRPSAPLKANAVEGGYLLNGVVPWVTGEGLFTHFVGAAVLAEETKDRAAGSAIFGLLPLTSRTTGQTTNQISRIITKVPMQLSGLAATRTVEVEMKDWFLPKQDVLGMKAPGWIHGRDRANPLSPLGLIFGCSQAGIDVLTEALERRHIDHGIAQQLEQKLASLQTDLPKVNALPEQDFSQKVAFRGRAISLMNTCAEAAIIASSGAANLTSHPAQRIYKESLVFSVSGQTTQGAIASLNALLSAI
ncbi:MAG: acyl-CoA dehydrogenase family protein [Cyanobacteria bacterium J06588_5]